jgi:effector-binding domain-containing protein
MITEPRLEQRDEQPYVAMRRQTPMQELGTLVPLWDEVAAWLGTKGMAPAGAPFFRYLVIDMEALLEVEVGWPVASAVAGEGDIAAGVLPAGRYAVLVHTGPYDRLIEANAAMMAWGKEHNITWQTSEDWKGWGARIESYETDPAEEPDPEKWRTELAILVADDSAR